MRLVIVGGVAAGASAATRYRRLDESAEIIILEQGPYVSYSNCAIPYHISGVIKDKDDLILMTPNKFLEQFNIKVEINSKVTAINSKDKSVTINNQDELSYDKLILAPGANAVVPKFLGLELINYSTLKTVIDVEKIVNNLKNNNVNSVCVIGGGFIGLEACENLREINLKTTLVDASSYLIPGLDHEMSSFVHQELRANNIDLKLGQGVDYFEENCAVLKDGTRIMADLFIMAVGVKPATDFLVSSEIKLSKSGHIIVDKNFNTNLEDVYAVGDVILVENKFQDDLYSLSLAGPAVRQARLVADVIAGKAIINTPYISSSIVKVFGLNVASTGLSLKQAKKLGYNANYVLATSSDKVSIMPNVMPIHMMLIFDMDSKKVLGAQAISNGASDKKIDVLATAIKMGITVDLLAQLELCYAPTHNTAKDIVNKLGYIGSNLANLEFSQVQPSTIMNLVDNNQQILDVRSDSEFKQLHVLNAVHIELSKLRFNLENLDKTKPVYVYCKSGQRSYNAVKILQHNGFEAYNIAGGMIFIEVNQRELKQKNKNYKMTILGEI